MKTRNSKIGIVCFWDRHATPYLEKYERILDELNIDYDVIFWKRVESQTSINRANEKEVEVICPIGIGAANKLISFFKWRKILISYLDKAVYSHVIVLSTNPAVLLSGYLKKHYSNKYIFDIRDYSLESNFFFKKLVMSIIEKSAFTTISSEGYYRWLDKSEKIILNHNVTYYSADIQKDHFFERETLNFAFVGNVRLDRQTRALLLTLKNSIRYRMSFVGRILPSSDIKQLCTSEGVKNITFKKPFTTNEKPGIYADIDLINAVYANDAKKLRLGDSTPIPNRLYDSIIFKCPIVASSGTYLAELVDEFKIGFSLNGFDPNAETDFNNYINNFNKSEFLSGCNKLLSKVLLEEANFLSQLKSTLLLWKGE